MAGSKVVCTTLLFTFPNRLGFIPLLEDCWQNLGAVISHGRARKKPRWEGLLVFQRIPLKSAAGGLKLSRAAYGEVSSQHQFLHPKKIPNEIRALPGSRIRTKRMQKGGGGESNCFVEVEEGRMPLRWKRQWTIRRGVLGREPLPAEGIGQNYTADEFIFGDFRE